MQLPPFQLERYFARHEFNVPHHLCASDCESVSVGDLLAFEPDASERLNHLWLGYTEPSGDPALRDRISRLYTTIAPDDVLVYAGAEEAIFGFMSGVLQSGDHLIVHAPGYQSLHEIARANGCDLTLWQTHAADRWELDMDELRRAFRPNTKAVVVNCPHNPTGYQMSHRTQAELVGLADDHGFLLFSDEVYRGLEQDAKDRLPAACDLSANGVSLGVLSKSYGLPGLRIGWIASSNRDVYAKMAAFKDYVTICNSAPSEFLATLALRHGNTLIARNLQIIRQNLPVLNSFFADHASLFDWQPPTASPIAFPSLRTDSPLGQDIETFCEMLARAAGVLLLPGTVYGVENHFRIGFGRQGMPQSVAALRAYLQSHL